MDLRSLAHLIRRYWALILATTVIAAVAALAVSTLMPRTFVAEAEVIVGPPSRRT